MFVAESEYVAVLAAIPSHVLEVQGFVESVGPEAGEWLILGIIKVKAEVCLLQQRPAWKGPVGPKTSEGELKEEVE